MASEKYCFGINTKMQVVVIVCKNAITQRSMELQEVEEGYMIKLQFQFFFYIQLQFTLLADKVTCLPSLFRHPLGALSVL